MNEYMFSHHNLNIERVLEIMDIWSSTLPTLILGILERVNHIWEKKYIDRAMAVFIIFSVMVQCLIY